MIDAYKQAGTICDPSADPERFVRGGSTQNWQGFFFFLYLFLFDEVIDDPIMYN